MGLLNVTRNKRRTLITVSMITFGMIVIIFTSGFLGSISSGLQEYLIESDTGELQIMAKGYQEKKMSGTLDYTIQNASKLLQELAKEPEIVAATERIAVGGLISNGNQSVYCWGTAVNLKTVHKTLPKLLVANNGGGNSLILNLPEGAVIGAGLAQKMGVTKGQTLVLVAYDKYGGMNAIDITITDIAKYAMDAENDALGQVDTKPRGGPKALKDGMHMCHLRAHRVEEHRRVVSIEGTSQPSLSPAQRGKKASLSG